MTNQYNKNTTILLDDINRMCNTGALQTTSCISLKNSIKKMETASPLDTTSSLDGKYEDYQKDYGIYLDDTKRFKSHSVDLSKLESFRLKTIGNKYLGYKDGKLELFKESDLLNEEDTLQYTLINAKSENTESEDKDVVLDHFYITFNGIGNGSGGGTINNYLTLGENDSVIVSKKHQLKSLWKFIKYNEQYYIESAYRPKHYLDTSTNVSSNFFIGFGKTETGKWSIINIEDKDVNTQEPPFSLSDPNTADSITSIMGVLNNTSNIEKRRIGNIIDTTILNNMTGTNCDIESFQDINNGGNTVQNLEKQIRQFYISEEKVNEIEKAFRNKLLEIAKLENNIEELEATIINSRKQLADNITSLETTPKEKSIPLPFGGNYKSVNSAYTRLESAITQIKKTIQESEKKIEDHKVKPEILKKELPVLDAAVQDAKSKRQKTVALKQKLNQRVGRTVPNVDTSVNNMTELDGIMNNIAELEKRIADKKDSEILQTVQRDIGNLTRERDNIRIELQNKDKTINTELGELQKTQEDKQHEFEQNQTINRNVITENENINKKLIELEDKENTLYSNSHLMGTNLKVIERQNTKLKYQTHALKSTIVLFSMIIIILLLVIIKKILIGK